MGVWKCGPQWIINHSMMNLGQLHRLAKLPTADWWQLELCLGNSALHYERLHTVYWWMQNHDDVITWKHFPRYWLYVRGIHRSPVNSPHKGQWRGALMFSLICAWINGWVNNREAGDLRRHRGHYHVILMQTTNIIKPMVIIIQSKYE